MCLWSPFPEHIGMPGVASGEGGLGTGWGLVSTPAALAGPQARWSSLGAAMGSRGAGPQERTRDCHSPILHDPAQPRLQELPSFPWWPSSPSEQLSTKTLVIQNGGLFCAGGLNEHVLRLEHSALTWKFRLHTYCCGDNPTVVYPRQCAHQCHTRRTGHSWSCSEEGVPSDGPELRLHRNAASPDSSTYWASFLLTSEALHNRPHFCERAMVG